MKMKNILIKKLSTIKEELEKYYIYNISINIETMDNPGWIITIEYNDLKKDNIFKSFNKIQRSKYDWITGSLDKYNSNKLLLMGGPQNLRELLYLFLKYLNKDFEEIDNEIIQKLEKWYLDNCDGNWEHYDGIKIELKDNKWNIRISISDTYLSEQEVIFKNIYKENNQFQYSYCYLSDYHEIPIEISNKEKYYFIGEGTNLEEILNTFIEFSNKYKYLYDKYMKDVEIIKLHK